MTRANARGRGSPSPSCMRLASDTRIYAPRTRRCSHARGSVHNINLCAITDSVVAWLDPSRRLLQRVHGRIAGSHLILPPYKFWNINNILFPLRAAHPPFIFSDRHRATTVSGIRRVRRLALSENLWSLRQKRQFHLNSLAFNTCSPLLMPNMKRDLMLPGKDRMHNLAIVTIHLISILE